MPESEFDPQDVFLSSGMTMLVRGGTFFGACLLGHSLGLLGTRFNSFASIVRFFSELSSIGEMYSVVMGTLLVSVFGVIFYWFLWPWALFFLYLVSQFFLDENGWKIWFPWLAGGQSLASYWVMSNVLGERFGWGVLLVLVGVVMIAFGWRRLNTKLYNREMQRLDAIEEENRKKREAKLRG